MPIQFQAEMVKAIADGKKNITRRICKKDKCRWCHFEAGTILWVKPETVFPRRHAELFLQVVFIGALEPLQAISEDDIIQEGFDLGNPVSNMQAFIYFWNSCHGAESWNKNPLVHVIEFKKL